MILFEFAIGLVALSVVLGILKSIHPIFGFIGNASAIIGACLGIAALVMGLFSN
jgi:hypothetical protein